jgi:hypothetical protein
MLRQRGMCGAKFARSALAMAHFALFQPEVLP